MDLLQVIIPSSCDFYIESKNKNLISIKKYNKINIDFNERVSYENGVKETIKNPLITYYVKIEDIDKNELDSLFDMDSFRNTGMVQTVQAYIILGAYNYKFKVSITGTASLVKRSMVMYDNNKVDLSKSIKIELKLENTNIDLFSNVDREYNKTKISRWDILDI